jgi:hypothetical protein
VWATVLGIPGSQIQQNYVLATREVAGPGAHLAGEIVGWLMPISFVVIVLLLWRARRLAVSQNRLSPQLEQKLVLSGSFALTAALIVFNKVGSPQYMMWLAPIVAVGLAVAPAAWKRPAQWMAATCFLTTLVFPILYMPLIDGHPFAAFVLLRATRWSSACSCGRSSRSGGPEARRCASARACWSPRRAWQSRTADPYRRPAFVRVAIGIREDS